MPKTIFITGASSGIGKAAALLFQKRGWQVIATMRTPEKETELTKLPNVTCLALDVTSSESIAAVTEQVFEQFKTVDVLLNNAGYGAVGAFELSSSEQVQKQFDVNVFGLMNVSRSFLPYFRSQKFGTVINVSSVGGRLTFPLYSIYHATKWAVEGFSESLQFELKQFGVRVKLIEPGAIKTDFYSRSQEVFGKEGVDVYDSYQKRILNTLHSFGANGSGPEVVAETIYRAATDGSSKLRYSVGGNAPALLMLRKILPDSIFIPLMRKILEK